MLFNQDNSFEMNQLYHAHPKHLLNTVKPYCIEIVKFPGNYLDVKDKRIKAVQNSCVHYSKAYDVTTMINPISCSYLLGENNYIVTPFVDECAKMMAAIEYFETKTISVVKNCQEVNEWYKPIFKMLDKKKFISAMLDDLTFWSSTYNFQYDKQTVLQQFNNSKDQHTTFLTKADCVK